MNKPSTEQIKKFSQICTKIVEIVNSSTGSIALTIMFYVMMIKNETGQIMKGVFVMEVLIIWVIWGFHAYNKISSEQLNKKETRCIGLLTVFYVFLIFIFTCYSINQFH